MKTIVITGSTDGLGLEVATRLAEAGHRVALHGRSESKLAAAKAKLNSPNVETWQADLSDPDAVRSLGQRLAQHYSQIDVLINNAGVFKVPPQAAGQEPDVRFMVNTFAPWLLTQKLLPVMNDQSRILNLSSAAQAPVDLDALCGRRPIADDFSAYAQSKLALTMWSFQYERDRQPNSPDMLAVNPGSLLATKMVREGFGTAGNDLGIGASVLTELALAAEIPSGEYFDNDAGRFAPQHADALDADKCQAVVDAIRQTVTLKGWQ